MNYDVNALKKALDGYQGTEISERELNRIAETAVPPLPETVDFQWYLHENNHYELIDRLCEQTGLKDDDPLWEKMGRPFYEVIFECTLDTRTGEVTINSVKL